MSKENQLSDVQQSEVAKKTPRRACDAAGLLHFLWAKFDSETESGASDEELAWLADASSEAHLTAANLGETLEGLAALIGFEIDEGGCRSGAFQPYGLPGLLYGAAATAKTISEMAYIGSEASAILSYRHKERATLAQQHLAIARDRVTDDLKVAAQAQAARQTQATRANAREMENA